MSNQVSTSPEFIYGTADHANDPVTVTTACILRQIHITESPSHSISIKDGTTEVFVVPAGSGVGTKIDYGDVRFETSFIVDFDASATTGTITAVYKVNHEGNVGSGYSGA